MIDEGTTVTAKELALVLGLSPKKLRELAKYLHRAEDGRFYLCGSVHEFVDHEAASRVQMRHLFDDVDLEAWLRANGLEEQEV